MKIPIINSKRQYETIAEEAYEDHIMIMKFLKNRDSIGMKSALTIHLHHAVINEQISFD